MLSKLSKKNIILIGLTGYKRSGKDTVGNYLVDNYYFTRIAFADTLKEACKIIFGFSDEQIYGDDLKEVVDDYWQHSPREILQKVGSDLFRNRLSELCDNISDDIWIRSVEKKIINLIEKGHTRFVITDVRYQNEINFIKSYNGIIWKINRPLTDSHNDNHESESNINKFVSDYNLINNSTREVLYRLIDSMMYIYL